MSDEHGPFAQRGPADRASMARDAEAAFERGFVAGWTARGRAEDAAILRLIGPQAGQNVRVCPACGCTSVTGCAEQGCPMP